MNSEEFLILRMLNEKPLSQRSLSLLSNYSLGYVNKITASLKKQELITQTNSLTKKGKSFLSKAKPKNAIILGAGYGLRMVPINQIKPKAFLTVKNKPLIERLIEQLHEVGITDITIVVGFMKEVFDYLIDKYSVKLIFNKNYNQKNNLHSLNCVKNKISESYILPCDLYFKENPFNQHEEFTWYSITETVNKNSTVHIDRKFNLKYNPKKMNGNTMIGLSFISKNDSSTLRKNITKLCKDSKNDNAFWEKALFENSSICVKAKLFQSDCVAEINSYEQLRDIDFSSKDLENDSIKTICKVFNCKNTDITKIKTLKKGMTNRSYTFTVNGKSYIMRIPGEGTNKLINRKQEAEVYNILKGKNICDELYYINPKNGMKISAFIENSRCAEARNLADLKSCMKKLRNFHNLKLRVDHEFNIYQRINFYESLWKEKSIFIDYEQTKRNTLGLKAFVDSLKIEYCLTHIDAVPDNFLFSAKDNIQLIDWEYAGMQDPHVDIAMFCIYSLYTNRKDIDRLIDIYFQDSCTKINRIKIYCYISLCGLLWSNWCEYKRQLGVEFGEYSLMQYRYAKDYYKIAQEEINKLGSKNA